MTETITHDCRTVDTLETNTYFSLIQMNYSTTTVNWDIKRHNRQSISLNLKKKKTKRTDTPPSNEGSNRLFEIIWTKTKTEN